MNSELILARLLGVLLGRGTFRDGDRPRVRFSVPNGGASELLEDLSRLGVNPSVRRGERWTSVESRNSNLVGALVLIGASRIPWAGSRTGCSRTLMRHASCCPACTACAGRYSDSMGTVHVRCAWSSEPRRTENGICCN